MDRNYAQLALFYDRLMQGIDYEAWVSYIEEIASQSQGQIGAVADLACGTGNSSIPWAARGYRTFGVDLSAEMLEIARAKTKARGLAIEFLQQDICDLQLDLPVDLAVCFQDGFNYIVKIEELRKAFQAVYRNLSHSGLFIFDLNYLPRIVSTNQSVALVQEDGFTMNWKAEYHEPESIWVIEVSGLIVDGDDRRQYHEKHREHVYEPYKVWSLLAEQGFTILHNYQVFTFEQPHDQSPRIVYVAQKI